MLNTIWPIFIISSVIVSLISGKISYLNTAIFDSTSEAVKMTITFLGTMCLWNGLMKIVQKTTLINKISNLLNPLMKFLFPKINKNEEAYENITVNIVANILGLGNAATPLGIKAMQSLQKKNNKKDTLSDSMCIFIILNTASLQIIPTTVIAIRTSLNSSNPCSIIVPVWIVTICADIAGIVIAKILMKKY